MTKPGLAREHWNKAIRRKIQVWKHSNNCFKLEELNKTEVFTYLERLKKKKIFFLTWHTISTKFPPSPASAYLVATKATWSFKVSGSQSGGPQAAVSTSRENFLEMPNDQAIPQAHWLSNSKGGALPVEGGALPPGASEAR